MPALLSDLVEQALPFIKYLRFRSRTMSELETHILGLPFSSGPILDSIKYYSHAEASDLREALIAEQSRGIALDEKTFKHSSSIATALTVASAATTAIAQVLTSSEWKVATVACTAPAICYVVIGGLLGFGAIRTLPTFGIGIRFMIAQNSETAAMRPLKLAEALACQEAINLIRVARNEAAFMSMRNGFVFVTMAVLMVLLGVTFATKSDQTRPRIWPASAQQQAVIA